MRAPSRNRSLQHDAAVNALRWPSQGAINNKNSRLLIRSPDSAAALTRHISTLVDPPPVNSLLFMFEPRRWRPPDHGGGSRRIVCYAINEKVQTNVIQYSPSYRLMHTQSAVPPAALQGWVEPLHHCNAELSWRARPKPPNVLGLFPQRSISSINACRKAGQYERCPLPLSRSLCKGKTHAAQAMSSFGECASRQTQCYNVTYKTPIAKQRKGEGRFAYQPFRPHSAQSHVVVLALRSRF